MPQQKISVKNARPEKKPPVDVTVVGPRLLEGRVDADVGLRHLGPRNPGARDQAGYGQSNNKKERFAVCIVSPKISPISNHREL